MKTAREREEIFGSPSIQSNARHIHFRNGPPQKYLNTRLSVIVQGEYSKNGEFIESPLEPAIYALRVRHIDDTRLYANDIGLMYPISLEGDALKDDDKIVVETIEPKRFVPLLNPAEIFDEERAIEFLSSRPRFSCYAKALENALTVGRLTPEILALS